MRRLLNTLYVSSQGTYLQKDGLSILLRAESGEVVRLPGHNLNGIVCFGRVSCSPALMHYCAENEILISFLDETGRFLARVEGPVSGNVRLRREQYRIADDPLRREDFVRRMLTGKLVNARAVLRRFQRDHGEDPEVAEAETVQTQMIHALQKETAIDSMRGLEGHAADAYFGIFSHLLLNAEFAFGGRTRRPPLDEVNALLSFVYTLLLHEVIAAQESVGLDPAAGYLHCERSGRASLALDQVEEFRGFLGDRFVLSLLNRRQLDKSHFKRFENGAVYLNDDGRKIFLSAWQQRKKDILEHPFLGEKIPLGLLFFVQARLLAKAIRGEEPFYLPYFWK